MSGTQTSVVKQATQHFREGDYQRAKGCYQKAGELYGAWLFANNIKLCDLRMGKRVETSAEKATEQQLAQTQNLLEHYFNRCQELEYQLLDRT